MEKLSTLKWLEFREYTIDRLDDTGVEYEPYWHVFIEDVLHPELFTMVQTEWPDKDKVPYNQCVPSQSQQRLIYNPDRNDEYQLTFWQDYYDNMIAHEDIVSSTYRLEGMQEGCDYITASLWEDYKGYAVGNHVDTYTIDVAWQTYIYCSGGEAWGTSMNDADGNLLKRFPFKANSAWLMRVDADAWHSCDPVDCDLRQSIMIRYCTNARG
jgi:hypothetical protein